MCALSKMADRGAKKCLEHPLTTLYLHMQCQRIKFFYILNILFFFLYGSLLIMLAFATKALMNKANNGTATDDVEPQEGDSPVR